MKSDLIWKVKKRSGNRTTIKNNDPEKDKIRGTVVQLLLRAAAPVLKPLRLPSAQMEVHTARKASWIIEGVEPGNQEGPGR